MNTRVNIMIDPQLLQAIDADAAKRGQTRSAWLAEAAKEANAGKVPPSVNVPASSNRLVNLIKALVDCLPVKSLITKRWIRYQLTVELMVDPAGVISVAPGARLLRIKRERYLLYVLYRTDKRDQLDTVKSLVVRAASIRDARKIAAAAAQDEGGQTWLDPKTSTCQLLTGGGKAGVIVKNAPGY